MQTIRLCFALAAFALPSFSDTITGSADMYFNGSVLGWGDFSFAGTGLALTGQGLGAGSMPRQLGTDPQMLTPTIMSDGGYWLDSEDWIYGTAIVDGVNYGEVGYSLGLVQTQVDGQLTQQQWDQGGSSVAPGSLTLELQGCAVPLYDVRWCTTGILFNVQFTLQGTNTLTWGRDGLYPSNTFNASAGTMPEPGSLALFGLGLAAILFQLRLRKRLFGFLAANQSTSRS